MFVTNVATSFYLYFQALSKFSLWLQERSKVGACCRETDFVCLTEKFSINHQIILLIWIFLKACSIQLPFRRLFKVFWFELQKSLKKIPLLCCSVFLSFCPGFSFRSFAILNLAFSLQNFWAGKRNSSSSCKSLFVVEENYFIKVLISLISLQWVMYEGSFQVRDGRWWKKIQECQTLKLGDAHVHPQ